MLILIAVAAGALTGLAFFMIYKNTLKSQKESIEKEKKQLMENAKREAESLKKEAAIHAKDLAYQAKVEAEREIRNQRS
jgi:ribonuclease Y